MTENSTSGNLLAIFAHMAASSAEVLQVIGIQLEKYNKSGYVIQDGVIENCHPRNLVSITVDSSVKLYSFICIIVFSMMVKRTSFLKNKCSGRPGLVIPMNMLNNHDYGIEYTLIFLSLCEEIYIFLFQTPELSEYSGLVTFFVKLSMVVLLSTYSYPFFAAICYRHMVWYIMVIIPSIANVILTIINAYDKNSCLTGSKIIPAICAALVYVAIDVSIVCLFVWKIVNFIKRKGWTFDESTKLRNQARDYSYLYVKELLKSKHSGKKCDQDEETQNRLKIFMAYFQCNELRLKIKNQIYRQIPGLSIPPRLFIGIFVGLYFAYRIFIETVNSVTPLAWNMLGILKKMLASTTMDLRTSFRLVFGNDAPRNPEDIPNACRHLTFFYVYLLFSCLIVSIFIGLINSVVQAFFLLRNYRLHFHRLVRKGFSSIIDIKKAPDPSGLIIGFVKYSGFQTAYLLWGIFFVITFVFLLLFILIGIFLLPLIYVERSFPRTLLLNILPVVIVSFIFNFLQSLFVKYVLMKEKGNLMEIDNRKWFMIYTHCSFFFNAMTGVFNSLLRIIVWIFSGIFTFSRIDFSFLPQYLRGFDSGYMCYIGFLYTEQYHHNPIMQCFSYLLLESVEKKQKEKVYINNKRLRYRQLWRLSLTLINNQGLLGERKLFLHGKLFD